MPHYGNPHHLNINEFDPSVCSLDDRARDRERLGQEHGPVPFPARKRRLWEVLQAASGQATPTQQKRLGRFGKEHDLQTEGEGWACLTRSCEMKSASKTCGYLIALLLRAWCRRNVAANSHRNWRGCLRTWQFPTPPWMNSNHTYNRPGWASYIPFWSFTTHDFEKTFWPVTLTGLSCLHCFPRPSTWDLSFSL